MNDEPMVERTDDPDAKASPTDQEPSANQADDKAAGRDLGNPPPALCPGRGSATSLGPLLRPA